MKLKMALGICLIFQMSPATIGSDQNVEALLLPSKPYFEKIKTLQFKSKLRVQYLDSSRPNLWVISEFRYRRPRYWCKTVYFGNEAGQTNVTIRAFDGERYQNYDENSSLLYLTREAPADHRYNMSLPFTIPFQFAFGQNDSPALDYFCKTETWTNLFPKAKFLGEHGTIGSTLARIELTDAVIEGLPVLYTVDLDKNLEFYPVGWTAKWASGESAGKLISEVRVTKYTVTIVDGNKFVFPLVIEVAGFLEDGRIYCRSSYTIDEDSALINSNIPPEMVSVSGVQAERVIDQDLKANLGKGHNLPDTAHPLPSK